MSILNITQHSASKEQLEAGVIDCPAKVFKKIKELLTFNTLPTAKDLDERSVEIAMLVDEVVSFHDGYANVDAVMIGGAGFFICPLVNALKIYGFKTVQAFSLRESVESTNANGEVVKTSIFRHIGFVEG